jgi:polyisoprenoid-binding protein YceI
MAFLKIALVSFIALFSTMERAETAYVIEPGSRLTIDGSSNVNKFSCACNEQFPHNTLRFEVQDGGRLARFSNANLHIRTKSLDCGNNQMNKDMYQTLRANEFPNIRIELTRAQLQEANLVAGNDWTALKANSTITIAGVSKTVSFDVKARRLGPDRLRFMASREVLMTDFNIDPPKAMLGLIKVNDAIRINLDLTIAVTQQPG